MVYGISFPVFRGVPHRILSLVSSLVTQHTEDLWVFESEKFVVQKILSRDVADKPDYLIQLRNTSQT